MMTNKTELDDDDDDDDEHYTIYYMNNNNNKFNFGVCSNSSSSSLIDFYEENTEDNFRRKVHSLLTQNDDNNAVLLKQQQQQQQHDDNEEEEEESDGDGKVVAAASYDLDEIEEWLLRSIPWKELCIDHDNRMKKKKNKNKQKNATTTVEVEVVETATASVAEVSPPSPLQLVLDCLVVSSCIAKNHTTTSPLFSCSVVGVVRTLVTVSVITNNASSSSSSSSSPSRKLILESIDAIVGRVGGPALQSYLPNILHEMLLRIITMYSNDDDNDDDNDNGGANIKSLELLVDLTKRWSKTYSRYFPSFLETWLQLIAHIYDEIRRRRRHHSSSTVASAAAQEEESAESDDDGRSSARRRSRRHRCASVRQLHGEDDETDSDDKEEEKGYREGEVVVRRIRSVYSNYNYNNSNNPPRPSRMALLRATTDEDSPLSSRRRSSEKKKKRRNREKLDMFYYKLLAKCIKTTASLSSSYHRFRNSKRDDVLLIDALLDGLVSHNYSASIRLCILLVTTQQPSFTPRRLGLLLSLLLNRVDTMVTTTTTTTTTTTATRCINIVSAEHWTEGSYHLLQFYAEVLSECSCFDSNPKALVVRAVQPLISRLQKLLRLFNEQCEDQDEEDTIHDTTNTLSNTKAVTATAATPNLNQPRPYLGCLTFLLSRRGNMLSRILPTWDPLLVRLSIAFDQWQSWLGGDGADAGDHPNTIQLFDEDEFQRQLSSLQAFGILSVQDVIAATEVWRKSPPPLVGRRTGSFIADSTTMRSLAPHLSPYMMSLLPVNFFSDISLSNGVPTSVLATNNASTADDPGKKRTAVTTKPLTDYLHDKDLLRQVFSFLGYKRVVRVRTVCRDWKDVADRSDSLWYEWYKLRFGLVEGDERARELSTSARRPPHSSWRTLFQNKLMAERTIPSPRFHARTGYRARICGYIDCFRVLRSSALAERHYASHCRPAAANSATNRRRKKGQVGDGRKGVKRPRKNGKELIINRSS